MRNEIIARFLLACTCLSVTYLAEFEENSLNHELLQVIGLPGRFSLWVLAILAVLALLDIVLNGTALKKIRSQFLEDHRQSLWMTSGLLYLVYAYVIVKTNLSVGLSLMFVIYGACSFLIAFKEALTEIQNKERSVGKREDRRQVSRKVHG